MPRKRPGFDRNKISVFFDRRNFKAQMPSCTTGRLLIRMHVAPRGVEGHHSLNIKMRGGYTCSWNSASDPDAIQEIVKN